MHRAPEGSKCAALHDKLHAARGAKDWRTAVETLPLLARQCSEELAQQQFVITAALLMGANQPKIALGVLDLMDKLQVPRNDNAVMLRVGALANTRSGEELHAALRAFDGRLEARALRSAASAFGELGMWREGVEVLQRPEAREKIALGSYHAVLQACVDGDAGVEPVNSVLAVMRKAGVRRTEYTCMFAIKAYLSAGDVDGALALLGEMEAAPDQGPASLVRPNPHTYATFFNSPNFPPQQAKQVWRRMLRARVLPDDVVYNAVRVMYKRDRNWERVLSTVEDMRKRSMSVPPWALADEALALYELGRHKQAVRIVDRMLSQGPLRFKEHAPSAFDALLDVCVAEGSTDRVKQVVKRMQGSGGDASVRGRNALMRALAKEGDWRQTFQQYMAMKKGGEQPDEVTYAALVQSCARDKLWERALAVERRMRAKGVPVTERVAHSLVDVLCYAGHWQQAGAAVARAAKDGTELGASALRSLVRAYARGGRYHQALQLAARIERSGEKLSSPVLRYLSVSTLRSSRRAACGRWGCQCNRSTTARSSPLALALTAPSWIRRTVPWQLGRCI